jgi:phosphoribosylamine---glycine ligase
VKVLLVGGGAREHAMAKAIAASEGSQLFSFMKNANPGIHALSKDVRLGTETDPKAVVDYAKAKGVQIAAIGPEAPLAAGVADALQKAGVLVAAPSQAAAAIETDKAFMRNLLRQHDVAGNIGFETFDDAQAARAFLRERGPKFALKPVGLTGGKGVQVYGDHFTDVDGAIAYVDEVFSKGIGGGRLIVEELLDGEEFTVQAFTDGKRIAPMVAVQDHKRLLPGDEGPNTGGMGSYSQADGLLPFLPKADWEESLEILGQIVSALDAHGAPYRGPIYGQFMLTQEGPRVIEVNARFGDPEAMNVLHLLESDFVDVLLRMAQENLKQSRISFREAATVVKYVVPEGYGSAPKAGKEIRIDTSAVAEAGAELYYAAVNAVRPGVVTTTTSRAVALLGEGETLLEANEVCEEALKHVKGDHMFVRHDIGTRELIERRLSHMRIVRES